MCPARPTPVIRLTRYLGLAGLLSLAAITLPDRGASLMYAAPWSICYWVALVVPGFVLLLRVGFPGIPLQLPTRSWRWLLAAVAIALLAAACLSPYRRPCLQWTALPLSGLATFLLVHDWLHSAPDGAARMARFSAMASGVLILASTGYWLLDLSHRPADQIFSTTLFDVRNPHPLGHSNYTAGLALLSLPWLALAAVRPQGFARFLAGLATGLAVLVLFTSGSRGGLLGLAALGVAALAGARFGWKRFALLAGAALVAAGALALANPRIRALLGPADARAAPNPGTVQRRAMVAAGLRMGADRPGLGWGLHTTPLVFPRYRAGLDGGAENVLELHSTPVELWAGLGATGVLLLGGFVFLAVRGWPRAPIAAAALTGYGVLTLTDYQFDVPVFVFALAGLAAQLAPPDPTPAGPRARLAVAVVTLGALGLVLGFGGSDPTPSMDTTALALARDPGQSPRAIALLRESLALNPDQEIAHFNLGWLLLVSDPAGAEGHFRAAAHLVPDKGGVYFGLGLARLNQGRSAGAADAFALECLNDPRFLASPWWTQPAIAAQREATQAALRRLVNDARTALLPDTWAAQQAGLILDLVPRLGLVSTGPESSYRRERTGYPVLTRNQNLPPPVDLYDVREDPRFAASLPFPLPPKGWLTGPLLLKLLDGGASSGH